MCLDFHAPVLSFLLYYLVQLAFLEQTSLFWSGQGFFCLCGLFYVRLSQYSGFYQQSSSYGGSSATQGDLYQLLAFVAISCTYRKQVGQ